MKAYCRYSYIHMTVAARENNVGLEDMGKKNKDIRILHVCLVFLIKCDQCWQNESQWAHFLFLFSQNVWATDAWSQQSSDKTLVKVFWRFQRKITSQHCIISSTSLILLIITIQPFVFYLFIKDKNRCKKQQQYNKCKKENSALLSLHFTPTKAFK